VQTSVLICSEYLSPVCRYNDNSQISFSEVVALGNTGIRSHEYIKTRPLCRDKQFAVVKGTPSHVHHSSHIVAGKEVPGLNRQAFIDKNA
jgi:hypothetical protein